MIRIKYKKIGNYLVTTKCFSTRTHEDLVYGAIELSSFRCFIVEQSVPRAVSELSSFNPSDVSNGSSLVDAKKKLKSLLNSHGVYFDVEVRNPRVSDEETIQS
jgi:hypothetical protein